MLEYNYHPVVCFGETLWDMLPTGKQAGGAPMNVAYNLQRLGKNPAIISKVGFDEEGKELINLLNTKCVCTDYYQIDFQHPTSVVKAIAKNAVEMSYTIVENVAWDYIELHDDLLPLVKQADYFVFGSLAARSGLTYLTLKQLLRIANKKVFDVNLRAPFYDCDIIEELLREADIVKLNLDELELIAGWFASCTSETERINLLKKRFQIQTVIVTKGAKGATLVAGDQWYSCNGLPVKVCDTVGSGDAFLAAILSKIMDGATPQSALHFANRLAGFITTKKGACPDYQPEDIDKTLTEYTDSNLITCQP